MLFGCLLCCSKPASAATLVPSASGTVTYNQAGVTLDASNTSQGYVMLQYSGNASKIKVQITRKGSSDTYTYNLNARSVYEVFPLTQGDGTYAIVVFEQVSGNQYMPIFSKTVDAKIPDAHLPFLYPNQYVNFSDGSAVVKKSNELAGAATDQIGILSGVYNYVIQNITYDTVKAANVSSGYLPNVDTVLAEKKGICFDYAAVMAAMLRAQNIPAKLVVGYTGGGLYHAWINVYLDNIGWVDNAIYFDGKDWKLMDPTFAAGGNQSEQVKQYIGDGANYQAKYTY
ncbi:MAG: transglutaminase-like domain-containing protein, partial [Hungatella sp.]